MPLYLYNGTILKVGNALAASDNCCCKEGCPIGQLATWAYYFTDADNIEIGTEETVVNEVIAQFGGTYFGYTLHKAFWVGNDEGAPRADGKEYYGEFQVWLVANCCTGCEDFYYQDKAEQWAYDWTRITDPSSQFEWDPNWAVGSCSGLSIQNDAGVRVLFECVRQTISFPSDPATGDFVLDTSIEVCCD